MNAADSLTAAGVRSSDTLAPPKERRTVLNQEDFMTLLSTQLKFQDPSKPMEANEMVAQMAQLSMTTGISDLKDQLADLSQSLTSSRASQAAQLVGREVLLDGESMQLPLGGPLTGAVNLPADAADLKLSIYDTAGRLVRQVTLGQQPAGIVRFAWDGSLPDGTNAAPGQYRVFADPGTGESVPTLAVGRVDSVLLGSDGQGVQLVVDGYGLTDLGAVKQVM
ncbi:flagellar hook assembly protein FlgD [Immundisolibacter sp.]|uniref:flagellar hook assembly protein FlgD n=1 Tax=Immundisolibacter sp. TaxID=1934948 RepID=UPI002B0F97AB|nr:flagellar hook assembly protein FlgD [Immundisolibacter sp.]MEA3219119.1 Basal-body rod modification protein FlgD [Immundisolibacter sp.]